MDSAIISYFLLATAGFIQSTGLQILVETMANEGTSLQEGDRLNLTCVVNNPHYTRMNWYKGKLKISENESITKSLSSFYNISYSSMQITGIQQYTLHINKLTSQYNGIYKCKCYRNGSKRATVVRRAIRVQYKSDMHSPICSLNTRKWLVTCENQNGKNLQWQYVSYSSTSFKLSSRKAKLSLMNLPLPRNRSDSLTCTGNNNRRCSLTYGQIVDSILPPNISPNLTVYTYDYAKVSCRANTSYMLNVNAHITFDTFPANIPIRYEENEGELIFPMIPSGMEQIRVSCHLRWGVIDSNKNSNSYINVVPDIASHLLRKRAVLITPISDTTDNLFTIPTSQHDADSENTSILYFEFQNTSLSTLSSTPLPVTLLSTAIDSVSTNSKYATSVETPSTSNQFTDVSNGTEDFGSLSTATPTLATTAKPRVYGFSSPNDDVEEVTALVTWLSFLTDTEKPLTTNYHTATPKYTAPSISTLKRQYVSSSQKDSSIMSNLTHVLEPTVATVADTTGISSYYTMRNIDEISPPESDKTPVLTTYAPTTELSTRADIQFETALSTSLHTTLSQTMISTSQDKTGTTSSADRTIEKTGTEHGEGSASKAPSLKTPIIISTEITDIRNVMTTLKSSTFANTVQRVVPTHGAMPTRSQTSLPTLVPTNSWQHSTEGKSDVQNKSLEFVLPLVIGLSLSVILIAIVIIAIYKLWGPSGKYAVITKPVWVNSRPEAIGLSEIYI